MRDALGLTKGTLLKIELEGSRIILRKNADDAVTSGAAVRAGDMQRRYKERRRSAGLPAAGERMAPDFLVGAHASVQCTAVTENVKPRS